MGLLADRARSIIASSKLSPVEKNILVRTFIIASQDPEIAAREILRRVGQHGVPLEEALRGLKHDWYRILKLLSTEVEIDARIKHRLLLRDKGQCCLTGASRQRAEAHPFHIISPAMMSLWLGHERQASVLNCLEAFITAEYSDLLQKALADRSPHSQLENTMLLSPTVGQAFRSRDIWLVKRRHSYPQVHLDSQVQNAEYTVFGLEPESYPGSGIADSAQLFDCTLHTDDAKYLPLPNPVLLKMHGLFAKKTVEFTDAEREVANPWPPPVSRFFWSRSWQLRFRQMWHFVPVVIRRWIYRQLIYRGQQSVISEIVYSLPFGLHAKFCGEAQGEPAALRLLETHAPSVPSPLFVDLLPLVADGKPWLIMTSLPGQRLDEVMHKMSYPERHKLADDLAAAVCTYRDIPNNSGFLIASASGGRLQDPRASANGCGPFKTVAGFNRQIAHGCTDDLARAFPGAHSRDHPVVFTHADLFPSNILVDAGRLSGIVDWQFAGYYPAYWEYTKAMRSVRHAEQYQAIFRRIFSQYEEELEVEEYLSRYFPISGPPERAADETCSP